MPEYYIYIMTNRSATLYVGMTSDLQRRVYQHKHGEIEGFSKRYRTSRLVYFESTSDVRSAIAREKQIKGWLRVKKVGLIELDNPGWKDLSAEWFDE